MSEQDPDRTTGDPGDESFLGRWSRLKAQARERASRPALEPEERGGDEPTAGVVQAPPDEVPPNAAPPVVELPDLEQLDQDSDYSAFLTPGVDAALRKRALRKLFHSPKFNVFDGLDTYRDDFTSFPPLGDVVTADMRHHLERLAKELVSRTEDAPPPAPPVAAVTTDAGDEAQASSAAPPPARTENDDDHGPA
jgi:hypothetical protein